MLIVDPCQRLAARAKAGVSTQCDLPPIMLFYLPLILGLTAPGIVCSTDSRVSGPAFFVTRNRSYCPDMGLAPKSLADLVLFPRHFINTLSMAIQEGHRHIFLTRLVKLLLRYPKFIELCVVDGRTLKQVHMCVLREQDINEFYVSTLESMEEYLKWAPISIIAWDDPKYVGEAAVDGAKSAWKMSDFRSFILANGSEADKTSLIAARDRLEGNGNMKSLLENMKALGIEDPKQIAVAETLEKHPVLLKLTPIPPKFTPRIPSEIIPVVLHRFARSRQFRSIFKQLWHGPDLWKDLHKRSLGTLLTKVGYGVHQKDITQVDIYDNGNKDEISEEAPAWEESFLTTMKSHHPDRKHQLILAVARSIGVPEALMDDLWVRYQEVAKSFSKIERIYQDVRTSLIDLYGRLLQQHNMDYSLATTLSRANPELIVSLWDNHLPAVAKFLDRPHFLDCTPRQFPLIFTRRLLASREEAFEAAILSLHHSGRQFYERIYDMFIQTGAGHPVNIPETFWDSVIAFDNDEAGRQLMKSDLKHVFQLEELPVLEKGMDHLRDQIKEAYVKAFLKVAGPEFQGIGIGKDGSLDFWISFPNHLYSTLKRSPQEAMWLALNASLLNSLSGLATSLTPSVSLMGLRLKCLLDQKLDDFEETLFRRVFSDYPSSFEALLNKMTLEEVSQLATIKDKHLLLTIIMDNPTVFPPGDAKKKAQDVAEFHGVYFTKPSILNGITSKPYSTILAILRDSQNIKSKIEKCLKSTEESMDLFRKRNATEIEDNQDKCTICLCGFDNEHPARAPKGCAHFYHQECIAEYCQEKTDATCPVCRTAVKPKRQRKKNEN